MHAHLIFVTKYRRSVFDGDAIERLSQHFQRVAFGIDSVECETENTLFVDDESRTNDAVFLDAVDLLRLPYAVLLARRAIAVREEAHGNPVLVTKFGMPEAIVAADAEDGATVPRKFVLVIGKIGGFERTRRRVVPRVEEENDTVLTAKGGEIDVLHVRIRKDEHRRDLSCFEHASSSLSRTARLSTGKCDRF